MALLNYPVYSIKTGKRLSFGPSTGAWGGTYGSPIFTGAEFLHVLKWIKAKGFHVYANRAYGGVNLTAHSAKSWHYVRNAAGISLGADIGTYGDVNERNRIINELIPVLDAIGMSWHYARNGHVPNHWDHIHIDVSNWGRKGGPAPYYGYYTTYKKKDVFEYLNLDGTIGGGKKIKTRRPRSISAYYGTRGSLVKIVQGIVGVKRDGHFGPATRNAVVNLQKKLKIDADGSFGPATARAYVASVGTRRRGRTGWSVQLIQWIANIPIDGHYGPATEQAVKELQAWAGIPVDGVFGPASRKHLFRA